MISKSVWTALIALVFSNGAFAQGQITLSAADKSITCEEAKTFEGMAANDPNFISFWAKYNQCKLTEYNKQNPDDKVVGVGKFDEKERKYFFDILSASSVEDIRKVCLVAHTAGGAAVPDPAVAKVFGVYGDLACDEYIKGIMNDDPFVVVFPLQYPSHKMIERGFKEVSTAVEKAAKDVKPEDVIAPNIVLPAKIFKKILKW